MASSLALRRLLSANGFPKSFAISTIRPLAITRSPASKLFNTNALRSSDDDNDESDLNFDRRSGPHLSRRGDDFFSDVFVPFSPKPYLSHVLNLMDQISENPVLSATRGVGEAGLRLGWGARETEDALHLRFDMPGLGKEDVKVSVEHNNILIIKGESGKEDNVGEEEAPPRRYNTGIGLPEKMFKTDSIKAEMKNGVLKVVLPKVKEGLKHTGWSSGCSEGEGRTTSRRCFETQQFKDLNTRDGILVENEFQIRIPTTRREIDFLAACEG